MKKLITKTLTVTLLFVGMVQLQAQCSFSGLGPAYCSNASAVTLTASVGGGAFSGPGVTGNVFSPSAAGPGTHTVMYSICTNTYNLAAGTFSWINTGGTSVSLSDDLCSGSLAIGFPFRFFCTTYTAFVISSNGFISFDLSAPNGCCTGQFLPSGTTPNNLIALSWEDFNPSLGGSITYTTIGTVGSRICVVTYSNIQHYGGGNPMTAQLQIYEGSNIIEVHHSATGTDGGGHTEGIEDANGSIAYPVAGRNSTSWSASNDMYRWAPQNTCTYTQSVYVDTTDLQITGPSTLCLHSSAVITASGTNTYTWNTTETTAAISVTPGSTSVYSVTGAAPGNLGCIYNTTHTITVYSVPLAASNSPQLLCVGSTATLTGTGASTYTWSTLEQANTTTVMPNVTTTYTLWGTSNLGCEEEITITQNVNTNVLSISSNTSVCKGVAATLTVTGGSTYSWSTVPPSPFAMITVTPNAMTAYSVAATDANGCYLEAFVTVSVNPNPTVTLNTPKTTVCKGDNVIFTAGGADTYQWSQGTSTGNTISVIPTVDLPLTVTVTGTNQFGCTNKNQITITVGKCTGINETANETSLVGIYPNPAPGIFNLKRTSANSLKAHVFNSTGALIATVELNEEITVLDLTRHAAGVYFVEVNDPSGQKQITRIINE